MHIRFESPDDAASIYFVNEQAFQQPNEAQLIDKLRKNLKFYLSLVAILDNQIVGHIFLSPVELENNSTFKGLGLAPLAVLPQYQRQGIGSKLVEKALEIAKETGYEAVVVLGHPHFYQRFGFSSAKLRGISCEYPVPDDVFMALELKTNTLQSKTGLIRYHSVFNEI